MMCSPEVRKIYEIRGGLGLMSSQVPVVRIPVESKSQKYRKFRPVLPLASKITGSPILANFFETTTRALGCGKS